MLTSNRYVFLDVFRGVVVLLMLEGHILRLVLKPELLTGLWFDVHEIFHGLTAPAFIFGAGFTFAIAGERKGNLLRAFNLPVVRRLWRAVLLILLGYALHLPYYSFTKFVNETSPEQWVAFLQFDVLHLIGFGLVFLRILMVLIRNEGRFLLFLAALTFLTVFVTPVVWSGPVVSTLPLWLASALTGVHGSFFPLFPFGAFLTAGAVTSWGFLRASREGTERRYMVRLFVAGLIMVPGGLLIDALPVRVYDEVDFWYTSPAYFWVRLGVLFMLLYLFWRFFRGWNSRAPVVRPSEAVAANDIRHSAIDTRQFRPIVLPLLTRLGVESLFVYVAHLLVLYGSVINAGVNVQGLLGGSQDLPASLAWTILFIALFSLAAYGWNYMKTLHLPLMRVAMWWIGLMWAGEFFLRPW